jgi:hypothetical protein
MVRLGLGSPSIILFFGSLIIAAIVFFGLVGMMAILNSICKTQAPFKSVANSLGAALIPVTGALAVGALFGLLLPLFGLAIGGPLLAAMAFMVPILLYTDLQRRAPGRKPLWSFVIANAGAGFVISLLAGLVAVLAGAGALFGVIDNTLDDILGDLGGSYYYY